MDAQNTALKTFGFAATEAAQSFIAGVTQALSRAAEAGLLGAPAYPAYVPAVAKQGIIRD